MNTHTIDLRSDTVTRPTPEMRKAMAEAEVGDDVFGDDPTVNELQELAAGMAGMEAALFLPSGTQSNLCALLSHCQRGDEYIVGQSAHTYRWEGGGAAVLGSIQPQPLDFSPDGTLDLDLVAENIKPDDAHFAKTRLLCLENTHGGKVLPLRYMAKAREFVDRHELGLHLDGARVFNASVKLQVPLTEITQYFDSVSMCLSKGLCAPVGSVLCGSREFIQTAHRWRKMVGGGMRQAGILAAAGIKSLSQQVERLADDHANAYELASKLQEIEQLGINLEAVQTNILFVVVDPDLRQGLVRQLEQGGVLVHGQANWVRLVTHKDFSSADINSVVDKFKNFFDRRQVA